MRNLKLPMIFVLLTAGLGAGAAHAEQVPAPLPDFVEGKCGNTGGVFFPKTGPDSTYGCINPDGSGMVCGGMTDRDKRTCDTFARTPPRLPTRFEAEMVDRAKAMREMNKTK